MTAADQPTTEPSAVERVAEHLYETADPADKEHYRDASHDLVAHSWCELAPVWRRRWIEKAQALADAGLLAPAPQPAADTEAEVQWGVRRPDGKHLDWDQEPTDSERRRIEARGDTVVKQHVTRTPWEEA